ncbi:MAG: S8 family serine peptidase [Acidobacteria bacterium]|nr:S8 family serine peptidase [Acidobacteriota bacterium]
MRLLVLLLAAAALAGQTREDRYILVLGDPPVAALTESRKDLRSAAAEDRLHKIEAAQTALASGLAARGIPVLARTQTLLNAVFVLATEARAAELRTLPGVVWVERLQPLRRRMTAALPLMNVPNAWNALGGAQNAGLGVRIGILDTGIDHNHPAFQDDSLAVPAGFPKCAPQDCAHTNRKIIAARSYVDMLVLGDQPQYSRPDDTSPRDRVGHGTAAATVAAGVSHSASAGAISGIAPKAQLGNYKVFGSPGVNDVTFEDVILKALEDAFNDGMDIVSVGIGAAAVWGPNDRGSTCGKQSNVPCDWRADAIENATRNRMAVVVAAGNSARDGSRHSLNTIETPGTAPAAITAGASTNSHIFFQSVRAPGGPGNLVRINALFGNGPRLEQPLTAPLRDVAGIDPSGLACDPLPADSLTGSIALILRGECGRDVKVNHAQKAGAAGVVVYQWEGANSLFQMHDLLQTGIPAALIGHDNGRALKDYIASNAEARATLDPGLTEVSPVESDTIAYFSSQGPSIGESAIKPEVVAVGTDLYLATQRYDPNGELYDRAGYAVAQGTSFAAPAVAGIAALAKQRNPGFNAAQMKSAVVNTANDEVYDFDANGRQFKARVTAVGAGKVDAARAVRSNVTVEPATLSFGVVRDTLPARLLALRNHGSGSLTLRLTVAARDPDRNARVVLSNESVTLAPGQSTQITARLEGTRPQPGSYEGVVRVEGGAVPLRIPFLYLVGDGAPFSILPLRGFDYVRDQNGALTMTFKVLDRYGVPVADVPIRFRATVGDGVIDTATPATDQLGIGEAKGFAGEQLGDSEFLAEAGGLTVEFVGRVRQKPSIKTNGVVNAASGQVGEGLAPGSYASIYGRALSEALLAVRTPYLPLSLAGVSVSFDLPSKRLSVPGRLHFVSEDQINVQIPWEFQGQSSVLLKVSIDDSSSAVYTVPLLDYSPAAFEFTDVSGRRLAAALDENYRLITAENAVARGRVVQIFCNGLGPVENQPASGELTPAEPLSQARVQPTVTIAGREARVSFAGLAPGNVGLYQINAIVDVDTPVGIQPVVITVNGVASKAAMLPIK